jgi:hypothetical protein
MTKVNRLKAFEIVYTFTTETEHYEFTKDKRYCITKLYKPTKKMI